VGNAREFGFEKKVNKILFKMYHNTFLSVFFDIFLKNQNFVNFQNFEKNPTFMKIMLLIFFDNCFDLWTAIYVLVDVLIK
jgi:hypothetical protein